MAEVQEKTAEDILLEDVLNALDVTFDDAATKKKIRDIIQQGLFGCLFLYLCHIAPPFYDRRQGKPPPPVCLLVAACCRLRRKERSDLLRFVVRAGRDF